MQKHITFFHGGGSQEDYEADEKLVDDGLEAIADDIKSM